MSLRWLSASLLVLALVGVTLWDRLPAGRRYNLLIVTIESWRFDALTPDIAPAVLAAAESGRLYTGHRAVSAWTIPNIVALLTGVSPFEQGIHRRGNALAAERRVPLEQLAEDGWLVGGLQSFMTIDEFANLGLTLSPGEDLMPWLARRALDRRRFALWYHYLDTHLPYAPAPPFRPDWQALLPKDDAGAAARIGVVMKKPVIPAGSVAFRPTDAPAITALHHGTYRQFDAWFAELWHFLDRSGLKDDTIVLLTADHGDEHLERGRIGHASTNHDGHLHEEIVRVPLVLWLPPSHPEAGKGVISTPTDHLLVMPSLARLARGQADRPGGLLVPEATRPWQALTSRGGFQTPEDDDVFLAAASNGRWKAMARWRGGRVVEETLYDLAVDPGERRPTEDPAAHHLQAVLAGALATMTPPQAAGAPPATAGEAPRWVWPAVSGPYGYDRLKGRFRLEWTGSPAGRYRIEYQAGEGASRFSGHLDVDGTAKDFGALDRKYWDTFVVPYGRIRLRVGAGESWSEWLDAQVMP